MLAQRRGGQSSFRSSGWRRCCCRCGPADCVRAAACGSGRRARTGKREARAAPRACHTPAAPTLVLPALPPPSSAPAHTPLPHCALPCNSRPPACHVRQQHIRLPSSTLADRGRDARTATDQLSDTLTTRTFGRKDTMQPCAAVVCCKERGGAMRQPRGRLLKTWIYMRCPSDRIITAPTTAGRHHRGCHGRGGAAQPAA